MEAQVGDIVLAKNRHDKLGRYIITKFGKQRTTFRGIAVVSSLRESQSLKEVEDLGACGYAILTLAYSDLTPKDILRVEECLGVECGEYIERRWKAVRQSKYDSKNPHKVNSRYFNIGRYTPSARSLPRQVTRICTGGMVRPK